jgi:hypothetical protein
MAMLDLENKRKAIIQAAYRLASPGSTIDHAILLK